MTTTELPRLFAVLGDDTRWEVLVRLGREPASASDLARELPVSRQAIVKHLDVLRGVALVRAQRRGRAVVYEADGARLEEVGRDLSVLAAAWDRRLARIKRIAESSDPLPPADARSDP
ncbi:metalloregulator ArsR/SmtB family transcription factor [Nocardiopsis sp. MG754419]|uniref:ArsR/SmtB family transcription factor n=1 Tax=Nocardiopsis sp. MG754419 TaxID=2259865 RepID=UPI001BA4B424|nr:metalloregulator ArsR/SmtB family transcription factor [Nocardiopsis sp. MG754419]MBR8740291.1 transcriptional regulator [Nocardiopsis sp. MG754419]